MSLPKMRTWTALSQFDVELIAKITKKANPDDGIPLSCERSELRKAAARCRGIAQLKALAANMGAFIRKLARAAGVF